MELFEVLITGLGHEGEGVGRLEGIATFVPGALPGEIVEIEVTEKKKNFQRGLLKRVVNPSPARIDAPCSVFEECGGCQLQHMSYDASLAWKRKRVEDVLQRIGKLTGVKVQPVLGMDNPWRYRNKAQLQVGPGDLGYFSSKTNRLVPFDDCLLLPALFNEIKNSMVEFLGQEGHYPQQVVFRYSSTEDEVMLGIVGQSPDLCWDRFLRKFSQIKSVVKLNPHSGEVKVLAGKSKIRDRIFGHDFMLSFQSFTQVNTLQTAL